MVEAILLIVAMAALCCMAAMTAVVFIMAADRKEKAVPLPEKTEEEKEAERQLIEQQKRDMEALQEMFYGPFFPKGGDRK